MYQSIQLLLDILYVPNFVPIHIFDVERSDKVSKTFTCWIIITIPRTMPLALLKISSKKQGL